MPDVCVNASWPGCGSFHMILRRSSGIDLSFKFLTAYTPKPSSDAGIAHEGVETQQSYTCRFLVGNKGILSLYNKNLMYSLIPYYTKPKIHRFSSRSTFHFLVHDPHLPQHIHLFPTNPKPQPYSTLPYDSLVEPVVMSFGKVGCLYLENAFSHCEKCTNIQCNTCFLDTQDTTGLGFRVSQN